MLGASTSTPNSPPSLAAATATTSHVAVAVRARPAMAIDELTFHAGDTLLILETVDRQGSTWYRGFIKDQQRQNGLNSPPVVGLFPVSHVIVKPLSSTSSSSSSSSPASAPVYVPPHLSLSPLPAGRPIPPPPSNQIPLPPPNFPKTKPSPAVLNDDAKASGLPKMSVSARIMALRQGGLQVEPSRASEHQTPPIPQKPAKLSPPQLPPPVDLPPAPPVIIVPSKKKPELEIKNMVSSGSVDTTGAQIQPRFSPLISSSDHTPLMSPYTNSKSITDLYRRLTRMSSGRQRPYDNEDVTLRRLMSDSKTMCAQAHLFFELKASIASICGHGEFTELLFSIYNNTEKCFISENYSVKLTFNGMPKDEEKIGKMYTIFADLAKRDLSSEIYLVCKIIRNGRLVLTEKDIGPVLPDENLTLSQSFRRPFGCAVLDVTGIIRQEKSLINRDKEYMMRIYTATSESQFSSLFENIINKTGGFETCNRAEVLVVSVDFLQGNLQEVFQSCARDGLVVTPRMGFPDIILPGDVRNSIYVTLVSGDFSQGRKASGRNVEVAVEVRLSNGLVLPDSIFRGSGERNRENFESMVFYHQNSPKWTETFRIDLPVADLDNGTHLFITLRQSSNGEKGDKNDKAFAFGVLPLTTANGAVISDASHTVQLFKYDKKCTFADVYGIPLLENGFEPVDEDSSLLANSKLSLMKETMSIRTSLCSTKLTHNISLLNLLRWKSLSREQLVAALKDFTFIGPIEITKYLQDILDTLFVIFQIEFSSGSDLPDLIFSDLVFILNIIISDRRFINFRPILDVYVRDHYGKGYLIDRVWDCLLSSMTKIASNPRDPVQGKELRSYLKALEYLFKFIVKSFRRCAARTDKMFSDRVLEFFDTTVKHIICPQESNSRNEENGVCRDSASSLQANSAMLIGAQILVLQNLHSALGELADSKLIPMHDLVKIGIDCLSLLDAGKKKIVESKLQLCSQLTKTKFLQDAEDRKALVLIFCKMAYEKLEAPNDSIAVSLSLQLVLDIMDALQNFNTGEGLDLLHDYSILPKTLMPLLEVFLSAELNFRNEGTEWITSRRMEAAVGLLSIMAVFKSDDLTKYLFSLSTGTLESLMDKVFVVFRGIMSFQSLDNGVEKGKNCHLSSSICQNSSKFMLLTCNVILKTSGSIAKVLRDVYNDKKLKDSELDRWSCFVKMLVEVVVSIPKEMPNEHGNDVCIKQMQEENLPGFAKLFATIWRSLVQFDIQAVSEMMGPFLELTIYNGSTEIRKVAIDAVVEMIEMGRKEKHHKSVGSLNRHSTGPGEMKLNFVEVECIDCLDRLIMTERRGDQDFRKWFIAALQERLGQYSEYLMFLRSVNKFLGLALTLQKTASKTSSDLVDQDVSNVNELALVLANLLVFTALLGRTRIYVKYIHRLVDIQLASQYCVAEAGWALKLHADLYEWDSEKQLEPVNKEVSLESVFSSMSTSTNRPKSSKDKQSNQWMLLEGLLNSADFEKFYLTQTAFNRKEFLYLCTIQLFSIAEHFEHAIELAEILAVQYRMTLFDYRKLSKIHQVIARLTDKLLEKERYYPAYYRVAFIGKGWSEDLGLVHEKQFVYRAKEWEKLGEFTERIMAQYPGAKISTSNSWPADRSLVESKEKWLQICMVELQPDNDRFAHFFDAKNLQLIPDVVRQWYENNDSNVFSYSRPFKKKTGVVMGGDNEFLNLWTETFTMRTEHPFPNFLRRSEIVEFIRTEVSPIENAVRNVEAKNRELELLEKKYRQFIQPITMRKNEKRKSTSSSNNGNLGPVNCNPLTMCLNGAVDAPVNGGIPMYRKAFLMQSFSERHPEYKILVKKLADLIDQQVVIISRTIALHETLVPPEMKPLHETIVQFFRKNFAADIERLGIDGSRAAIETSPVGK